MSFHLQQTKHRKRGRLTEELSIREAEELQKFLRAVLTKVKRVALDARKSVEGILEKKLNQLEGDDRDYALDEIQDEAEQSDAFIELVFPMLCPKSKNGLFFVKSGEFEKTSTGWPVAWSLS